MHWQAPPSSAHVDINTPDNATFSEAFQFDDADVTYWNFTDKTFRMDIKPNRWSDTILITLTSADSQILVDDAALRVLHFDVGPDTMRAAMPPGKYVYDLLMTDINNVVTQIAHGEFWFSHGVTGV